MKRVFLILPIVSVLSFLGYYRWRAAEKELADAQTREERARSLIEAKGGLLGSASIIGRNGASEANEDIARGAPKLLLYGRERADIAGRTLLFRERFGVTIDPMAGCIVNQPLIAFAEAYNAAVQSYVSAKFGPTAFDKAERDASQVWLSKQRDSLANRPPDPALAPATPPSGHEPRQA